MKPGTATLLLAGPSLRSSAFQTVLISTGHFLKMAKVEAQKKQKKQQIYIYK